MSKCGSYSEYVAGCRCSACTEANRAYHRKRRESPEQRKQHIMHSKRRNHAAMLALRWLKQNNPQQYFACMDEARAWMNR